MSLEHAVLPKPLQGSPREDRLLPAHPFYALRYHFGMLLGVEDFEAEQAYHRGKHRLHNGWLHGDGVVWGLEVSAPGDGVGGLRGEIQVDPGLALDPAGCELHLDTPVCVNIGKWYEDRKAERVLSPEKELVRADGTVEAAFSAYVVGRFRACLMRPVPAMTEPCEGASRDTEYSRAFETVELLLRAGEPPDPPPPPYHRLRLLFGLDAPRLDGGSPTPGDQAVLDFRTGIHGITDPAARAQRALEVFRILAARDGLELRHALSPSGSAPVHFPAEDRTPVLLATLKLRLLKSQPGADWRLVFASIDNERRSALVATRTIQELLTAAFMAAPPAAPATPAPEPAPPPPPPAVSPSPPPAPADVGGEATRAAATGARVDAGGPRVDPGSLRVRGREITFTVTEPLLKKSVTARAFRVSVFDTEQGWLGAVVQNVGYDTRSKRVKVELEEEPVGELVRLVIRGTSDWPMLDRDLVPFAGAIGGPPGTRDQGNDVTFMLRTRS